MKLIVGLGNPGAEYDRTRHNVGFEAVEALFASAGGATWKSRFQAEIAEVKLGGESAILMKPQTFMNRSGNAVGECAGFFKIGIADVLVAHDEIDLPLGTIRVKCGGGDAGHNGIKSVAHVLGSRDFARVRLGVGRPTNPEFEVANWVLGRFSSSEAVVVGEVVQCAVKAIEQWAVGGVAAASRWVSKSLSKPVPAEK